MDWLDDSAAISLGTLGQEKRMKPNINFLRKVAAGEVYPWADYTARSGRTDKFRGGEATAQKHADAGFVTIKWPTGVMRRGSVTLTVEGGNVLRAALRGESEP